MYQKIISRFPQLRITINVIVVCVCLLNHAVLSANTVEQDLIIPLYKSSIFDMQEKPIRVSLGNPAIADIVVLRNDQVHIVAKSLGTTNVVFWDKNDRIFQSINIEVTHDLAALKKKLHRMFPSEPIKVFSAQEKLILSGEMSSAGNVDAAIKVAQGYLPGCHARSNDTAETSQSSGACGSAEVVNLLEVVGSQQVMLEVKVAEMSRSFLRSLDTDLNLLNFNAGTGLVNGGSSWPNVLVNNEEVPFIAAGIPDGSTPIIGPVVSKFQANTPSISDKGLYFQDLIGDNLFHAALEMSRSNGLAKVLAEPNLTTLTGRSAEFISGGEFPVPVPQDGRTSIVFKDYGVNVKFIPTILDLGRISLDLDIIVSELSEGRQVNIASVGADSVFSIPTLSKRGVSSTVELANGQTIGIAGLIQDNVRQVINKLPGIGDIPVLGQLFRSQEFISGQTELVIFVTAHLANPIDNGQIKLPTDSFVPPSDIEFYLLGRMEARESGERETGVAPASLQGGTDGLSFGHDL